MYFSYCRVAEFINDARAGERVTFLANSVGKFQTGASISTDEWDVGMESNFPKGAWHHVAFTFDSSTNVGKIYKNGNSRVPNSLHISFLEKVCECL